MRKLIFILFTFITACTATAQTMQEKLYYTCKVWGFVKYYHSEVSICNVNWDSVLIDVLPDVRAAASSTQFNDALMHMINAAGPMAIAPGSLPDTIPVELKRNRDWTFISSPMLRADVQAKLNLIKDNFRPHPICWVKRNDYTTSNNGWLIFPYDSVCLNLNTSITYPNQDDRLLQLFKYWNIIRYFNPYNYVTDTSWETVLFNYSKRILDAPNAYSLYVLHLKIASKLDDAHVQATTYSSTQQSIPGFYKPLIRLKYIQGKYVVLNSLESGITSGDVLISVDGKTTAYWEDTLKQYYSVGNESVLGRTISDNILGRKVNGTLETIVVQDSNGIFQTHNIHCSSPASYPDFYGSFYHTDSLKNVIWTTICETGYVNMGNLMPSQVNSMYVALKNKDAIIFDLRQFPNVTGWDISDKMYASRQAYVRGIEPNVNYPGTFIMRYNFLGIDGNPNPYDGKVIILMNENTQSQGEFTSMMFEKMPDAVKVGSQTAGADGNVTFFKLSKDMNTGFSTIGIYYPDGDSTQRIGIVPDTVVYPTVAGIRRHRDEVLEKALKIAGCDIFPPIISEIAETHTIQTSVVICPNPANEVITISFSNVTEQRIMINITDISGKVLMRHKIENAANSITTSLDIRKLSVGMYFVNISYKNGQATTLKFIKEP